ncbi:hypothetical protein, partial [Vibrio anguillarum]|uniref:hypothetical protein n=1 Tax=Vibrio anguillarum TaxID=55601 RepID=UPI0030EC9C79
MSTFRRCTIAPHCDKEAFNDYSPTHTLALETMQQNRFERFAMISAMTKMAHSIEKKRTEQQAAAENLIRW